MHVTKIGHHAKMMMTGYMFTPFHVTNLSLYALIEPSMLLQWQSTRETDDYSDSTTKKKNWGKDQMGFPLFPLHSLFCTFGFDLYIRVFICIPSSCTYIYLFLDVAKHIIIWKTRGPYHSRNGGNRRAQLIFALNGKRFSFFAKVYQKIYTTSEVHAFI